MTLTYAGFASEGSLTRFLLSDVDDWAEPVTLQPGASTDTFFMKLGSPDSVGNESQQTTASIRFGWNAAAVAVEHTVTFYPNAGEGTMDPQTAAEPMGLTPNAFTREGYEFLGWNTDADGTGTAFADGATFAFDRSLTLYAQWEAVAELGPGPTPDPTPDPTPSPTPPPSAGPTQPPAAGPTQPPGLASTGSGAPSGFSGAATLALLLAGGALLALRRHRASE